MRKLREMTQEEWDGPMGTAWRADRDAMRDEEYNRVPPVPVGTFMMIPKSEWAKTLATIATLTAELDALKAQVEWAQAANNGWQKSNASLATQVAVLREAMEPFAQPDLCKTLAGNAQGDASPVYGRDKATLLLRHFRVAEAALSATPADFDCIVEVAKAGVKLEAAEHDDYCSTEGGCIGRCPVALADSKVSLAVSMLTPTARELLQ